MDRRAQARRWPARTTVFTMRELETICAMAVLLLLRHHLHLVSHSTSTWAQRANSRARLEPRARRLPAKTQGQRPWSGDSNHESINNSVLRALRNMAQVGCFKMDEYLYTCALKLACRLKMGPHCRAPFWPCKSECELVCVRERGIETAHQCVGVWRYRASNVMNAPPSGACMALSNN